MDIEQIIMILLMKLTSQLDEIIHEMRQSNSNDGVDDIITLLFGIGK